MTAGTRSVLYGAHCFLLHPWFVALAWWRLYGFPWDPRLWVAFLVHDLGYLGKPNMDGPEGETHPALGARIMARLFDGLQLKMPVPVGGQVLMLGSWGHFTLLHSRYLAKSLGLPPSRLCMADKLAIALTPWWLYLPMVMATGEIDEYMAHARHSVELMDVNEKAGAMSGDARLWYRGVQSYCRRWAHEHRDGRADAWTADARQRAVLGSDGVWR